MNLFDLIYVKSSFRHFRFNNTTSIHKMFKEIFKEMFQPSKAAIIASLKRSDGLPVSDVAKEVEMSYMGVKQHCINLEKMGFVESWRVPRKEVGRPEKLYKLTSKCDELFPVAGAEFSIELLVSAKSLFGEDAPEKLLRNYFVKKKEQWEPHLAPLQSLHEKASKLSQLREEDGFFNSITTNDNGGFLIKEYHNPFDAITEQFPVVKELELNFLESLLGTQIDCETFSGPHGQKQTSYGQAIAA